MLVKTLVAFNDHKVGAEVEYAKADAERLARAGKVEFMSTTTQAPPPQKRKTRKRKKKHSSYLD